jgi:predicted nucleic acid-binding protein
VTFQVGQAAVVVDASTAIKILQDHGAWGNRAEAWIRGGDFLLVPPIFRHEVANALLRSARLSRDDVLIRLPKLEALGLEVADRGFSGLERSIELADRHGLTVYDAAYLELAIDVDAELATDDRDLRRAAQAEGIVLAEAG